MTRQSTMTWLKVGSILVMLFGVLSFLSLFGLTSSLMTFLVDLIFWPVDGAQSIGGAENQLLLAIFGGIMMGWGVMLWQITTQLYPRDPILARSLILTSIGVWFVVDGVGSILAGAPLNAVLNLSFLIVFFVPLWRPLNETTA